MRSFITTLLAATALAAPLTSVPSLSKRNDATFLLKTQLINGYSRFDNLYVESYHTGAGLSDATLSNSTEYAAKGFLNGTEWQFDLGNEFPWGLTMYGDTNYAAWEPVTINAGGGSEGFYFNETVAPGLLWGAGSADDYEEGEFKDWLACDWSHGVPQVSPWSLRTGYRVIY